MKLIGLIILVSTSFILGIVIGFNLLPQDNTISTKNTLDKYPYLAKRIFLENPNDVILNFTSLRDNLRMFADKAPNLIGIYFEYLPTGTTIGVNDRETFFAASLLKTPMVMETMKRIEAGEISENEVLIIEEADIDKGYGDLWKKGVGTKVTVKEAIELSMIDSDNTAYRLLRKRIKDKDLKEVFSYLDIPRDLKGIGGGITAKNYSSILRSLYFSAYLSFDKSNELLRIMSMPSEGDLLGNKLPENIKVANKYGVYTSILIEDQEEVYSDCGIIYLPKRNYSLCVMVQGATSSETAKKQIIDISETVYEFILSSNTPKK